MKHRGSFPPVAPERIWSGGTGREQKWGAPMAPEFFFGRAPPPFGSKSTISRFGERFCDGQYSLVSFLFAVLLYSRCPRTQPFVKVGGTCPPCPIGWTPLTDTKDRDERTNEPADRDESVNWQLVGVWFCEVSLEHCWGRGLLTITLSYLLQLRENWKA